MDAKRTNIAFVLDREFVIAMAIEVGIKPKPWHQTCPISRRNKYVTKL